MNDILMIYYIITVIVLLVTGMLALDDQGPEEIDNVWDWIVYGLLWIVLLVKALFKYIKNLVWKK